MLSLLLNTYHKTSRDTFVSPGSLGPKGVWTIYNAEGRHLKVDGPQALSHPHSLPFLYGSALSTGWLPSEISRCYEQQLGPLLLRHSQADNCLYSFCSDWLSLNHSLDLGKWGCPHSFNWPWLTPVARKGPIHTRQLHNEDEDKVEWLLGAGNRLSSTMWNFSQQRTKDIAPGSGKPLPAQGLPDNHHLLEQFHILG